MSFRKELDLEERLNKISSKAVREPEVEDRTTLRQIQTSTEKNEITDIKQLQIEAQLAKISSNAIVDKLGLRPSKIKTDVTKEMILDYQNEMNKPIEVEDEFGNKIKYKYHPSSVDLDEIEYVPIHDDVLNPIQIVYLRKTIKKISNETIPRLEAELNFLANIQLKEIQDRYDEEIAKVKLATHIAEHNKPKILIRLTRQLEVETRENNRRQLELIDKIRDEEAILVGIQNRIDTNEIKKKENRAELVRIQKENSARLKAYEEDLNLLNRGRLNVTREPNESDEDYRQRLFETGQTTINEDDMAKSAELYNRDKLRERVLELVRDTGIISNALKFLDEDQVFKINQNWSRIKRDFIKVYGFDNLSVKEADLIAFFEQEVDPIIEAVNKGKAPPVGDLLGAKPDELREALTSVAVAEVRAPEITEGQLNKMSVKQLIEWVAINHKDFIGEFATLTTKSIKIKFIIDQGWTEKPTPQVPITSIFSPPKSPALGSSLARRVYSLDEMKDELQKYFIKIRVQELKIIVETADLDARDKSMKKIELMDAVMASRNKEDLYMALDELETLEPDFIKSRNYEFYPRIVGSGLKPITHDIPNLIEFGKVKISPRKLYYNNTLAIKHKSGHSLAGLPNVQVSEKFVSIIMNLLKGQKPSLKDFTQLDLNEKGIYDTLINIAGLQKEVDNNFGETKQHLKKRLELVEGEIGAGNTNPALKKELHALLGKMAHTGMIGYGDAKKHYLSVTRN